MVIGESAEKSGRFSLAQGDILADAAVAALVGFFVFWSPVTTANRFIVSVAGGVAAAIALFGYRCYFAKERAQRRHERAVPRERVTSGLGNDPFMIAAGLLLLGTFLPTMLELVPFFEESVWRNTHGLFMPLLLVAVVRAILRRSTLDPNATSFIGLVPLALGLSCTLLDLGVGTQYLSVVGFSLATVGWVAIFFGTQGVRTLAAPLVMLIFLLPIPAGIGASLGFPTATAVVTESMLRLIDFSFWRDASMLLTKNFSFGVSARCSGWGLFYGALLLSIAFGAVVGSWKRTLLMALLSAPVVLFANGLRLAGLIIYCEWAGVSADQTPVHGLSGILAFLIVSGCLFILAGSRARRELLVY